MGYQWTERVYHNTPKSLTGPAYAILHVLAHLKHDTDEKSLLYPAEKTIAAMAHLGLSTVEKWIPRMEKDGLIRISQGSFYDQGKLKVKNYYRLMIPKHIVKEGKQGKDAIKQEVNSVLFAEEIEALRNSEATVESSQPTPTPATLHPTPEPNHPTPAENSPYTIGSNNPAINLKDQNNNLCSDRIFGESVIKAVNEKTVWTPPDNHIGNMMVELQIHEEHYYQELYIATIQAGLFARTDIENFIAEFNQSLAKATMSNDSKSRAELALKLLAARKPTPTP